jgi:hypothetical protein
MFMSTFSILTSGDCGKQDADNISPVERECQEFMSQYFASKIETYLNHLV